MSVTGRFDPNATRRWETHRLVSAELRALSDRALAAIVAEARPLGSGIGGNNSLIDVGGVSVFVKRVRLTDVESQIANIESTRDLFDMPPGCQYGVGSPGIGVWREVAANTKATGFAIDRGLDCFAAMYHWRVLDGSAGPLAGELTDIETLVSRWHDSAGVRRRAEAMAAATAQVALFLEYVPTTLPQWLQARVDDGADSANAAIDLVEQFCTRDVAAMNDAGLFHFDAHFDNMLVNGDQILLADFGLATSPSFELSQREREFLERTASHDVAHTITRLVDWLVTELVEPPSIAARDEFIESIAATSHVSVPMVASARRVIERYAPVAAVINGFYAQLHTEDRTVEYPTAAVLQAFATAGLKAV